MSDLRIAIIIVAGIGWAALLAYLDGQHTNMPFIKYCFIFGIMLLCFSLLCIALIG
jgi:hypothetical protein